MNELLAPLGLFLMMYTVVWSAGEIVVAIDRAADRCAEVAK